MHPLKTCRQTKPTKENTPQSGVIQTQANSARTMWQQPTHTIATEHRATEGSTCQRCVPGQTNKERPEDSTAKVKHKKRRRQVLQGRRRQERGEAARLMDEWDNGATSKVGGSLTQSSTCRHGCCGGHGPSRRCGPWSGRAGEPCSRRRPCRSSGWRHGRSCGRGG